MAIILVTEEASKAFRRIPPTDKQLIRILNGYEMNTMPTTEQARWLAAYVLVSRGYILNKAPKEKGKKKS